MKAGFKIPENLKKIWVKSNQIKAANFESIEPDPDKTGKDNNADKTIKTKSTQKSKLEMNPDSTGIDTKADKTKKEKVPVPQRKK